MSTQFIHLETYSRKVDRQGRSVSFVLAEAAREAWACYHVARPEPPVILHGLHPLDVLANHDELVTSQRIKTATGIRAIRCDQHTLWALVSSFNSSPSDYSEWEQRTLKWLQEKYGERIVSVVRHTDESCPHLHAYALPAAPEMQARKLHPGAVAKDKAIQCGASNRAGDAAYRSAMRELQDDYWLAVCAPLGIPRLGPSRRRMSRAEWHREKTERKCKAAAVAKISHDMKKLREAEACLKKWQQDLEQAYQDLRKDHAQMRREIKQRLLAEHKQKMRELVQLYEAERERCLDLQEKLEQVAPDETYSWQESL